MCFLKVIQLMAVVGLVSGCQFGSTDRLVADVGLNPYDPDSDVGVGEDFDRRVQAAFPAGTPVAEMVTRLEAAGFSVDPERRAAHLFQNTMLVCSTSFDVWWAGDEVVEAVNTSYHDVCL